MVVLSSSCPLKRENFFLFTVCGANLRRRRGEAEKMQHAHVSGLQLEPYAAIPAIGFPRVEGEKRDR